jgi:hypothetical protein
MGALGAQADMELGNSFDRSTQDGGTGALRGDFVSPDTSNARCSSRSMSRSFPSLADKKASRGQEAGFSYKRRTRGVNSSSRDMTTMNVGRMTRYRLASSQSAMAFQTSVRFCLAV